jgi:hypothetical protein
VCARARLRVRVCSCAFVACVCARVRLLYACVCVCALVFVCAWTCAWANAGDVPSQTRLLVMYLVRQGCSAHARLTSRSFWGCSRRSGAGGERIFFITRTRSFASWPHCSTALGDQEPGQSGEVGGLWQRVRRVRRRRERQRQQRGQRDVWQIVSGASGARR